MLELYNFIQKFIYDIMAITNWLFEVRNFGFIGYMSPIELLGVSTLVFLLGYYLIRGIIA